MQTSRVLPYHATVLCLPGEATANICRTDYNGHVWGGLGELCYAQELQPK